MESIKTKVFESLGEASMCWSETPKGVFESNEALRIGNELMAFIEQNSEMAELFNEVTEWQEQTFKKATALSKIAHLKKEIRELEEDVEIQSPNRRLEFADCFILLMGAAAKDGMSCQDVLNAIREKLTINKGRTWGKPDKDGVVEHI